MDAKPSGSDVSQSPSGSDVCESESSRRQSELNNQYKASQSQYPEDETDRNIRVFFDWIKEKDPKISDWILAATSIALTVIGLSQLAVSCANYRDTSPLVGYAEKTSTAAQQFADAAKGINTGVGIASGQLGQQVGKLDRQAGATEKAAGAAASAATTSEEAFHVSERAYITIQDPNFDFSAQGLNLPIVNSGHLPSGGATIVVHRTLISYISPTEPHPEGKVEYVSWQHSHYVTIDPGNHEHLVVPFPGLEEAKFNNGTQVVVVAGKMTYNDGFADTPDQNWEFCFRTYYHLTMRKGFISPCEPSEWLPKFEAEDGYPNNEHKN